MNTLRRNISKAGYSQEELYFFEQSQKQIQELKERPKLELIRGGLDSRPRQLSQGGIGRKAA